MQSRAAHGEAAGEGLSRLVISRNSASATLQNFADFGIDGNVRLRESIDLKTSAGSRPRRVLEMKEAAYVVVLIQNVEDPLGLFARKP